MPIISIIVPVYNTEAYLRRCLESILTQTFTDFECILIDDGSLDNCPMICDEYATKDNRIIVIHQKNSGVSIARNIGLNVAKGEWINFVDSDDWLEPNALELLYRRQKETDAKIIIGNFRTIYFESHTEKFYTPIKNDENIIEWFLLCEYKFLWGKLYNRTLFENYTVPETNILEDGIINLQLFLKISCNEVQFISSHIYNYNVGANSSAIARLRKKKYHSYLEYPMINAHFHIYEILEKTIHESTNIYSAYLFSFLYSGIISYLKNNNKIRKKEIRYFYAEYYKNCSHLYLMKTHHRFFLPIYHFSIVLGKAYTFLYQIAFKLRDFMDAS